MIFVTVGEQLPFDRLIHSVNDWSKKSGKYVFAQIGSSLYKPSHIDHKKFLNASEFNQMFHAAEIIISHAGMGTIISALEMNKPIIVMPRKSQFKEARSNHQFSTAKRFLDLNYISVAFDENDLMLKLNNIEEIIKKHSMKIDIECSFSLTKAIRDFIQT